MGATIVLNCVKGHADVGNRLDGVGSDFQEPSPSNAGTPTRDFSTRGARDHVSQNGFAITFDKQESCSVVT